MLVSPERSQRPGLVSEAHGSSPVRASSECRSALRSLDLQKPNERRLVLFLKRDHVEHAETLVVAGDDLLTRLDHHRVGRFACVEPFSRWSGVRMTSTRF